MMIIVLVLAVQPAGGRKLWLESDFAIICNKKSDSKVIRRIILLVIMVIEIQY